MQRSGMAVQSTFSQIWGDQSTGWGPPRQSLDFLSSHPQQGGVPPLGRYLWNAYLASHQRGLGGRPFGSQSRRVGIAASFE
jgi:hypothetical protein